MTLHDEWLADPSPLSFAEWKRQRSVPAGLLNPAPPQRRKPEAVVPVREVKVRDRTHGTGWGWRQHRKLGEEPCEACWEGKRADDRKWRAAHPRGKGRKLVPCGHPTAARRHRRRGEEVCAECRAAESAASRNAVKRKSQREWIAQKRLSSAV